MASPLRVAPAPRLTVFRSTGERRKVWLVPPMAVSAVVLVFSLLSISSLIDASGTSLPLGTQLELSVSYLALSPLSRVLDGLTLLSVAQQAALLATFATAAIVWTLAETRQAGLKRTIIGTARALCIAVAAFAVLNLAASIAPRPMAALAVSDPRIVRIDFHSHTNASHDARRGFTPEENRAWHSAGGFDVAYISDHRVFAGAAAAEARNPQRAGDGTVLLSALEARYLGLSTVIVGISAADSGLIDAPQHLRRGLFHSGRKPVSIAVLPGPLSDVMPVARDDPPDLVALELSDAAPRALGELDNKEAEIRRRSAALGVTIVAGSNNHGWGRTVAAWNLMQIDGWRSLRPDSLGVLIENTLRNRAPKAVGVVERVRPRTHGLTLPLTLPVLLGQILRTLTQGERVIWIAWIWAAALLMRAFRREGAKGAKGAKGDTQLIPSPLRRPKAAI